MRPLTEQDIRIKIKREGQIRLLTIPSGTLITPSAAEFLHENNITLEYSDISPGAENTASGEIIEKKVYIGPEGQELDYKPEDLTHLYGNQLTKKDNPIIVFRGKLDELAAMIVEAQVLGEEKGNTAYVKDLQEIVGFVRSILPAEYKNEPVNDERLLGLSYKDVRERSHHPEKYFGRKHLYIHYTMGLLVVRLNSLRAKTRQVELAAVKAFNENPREDIIEALNRLSSLFYVLMYKYLPPNYVEAGSAGI
jgi:ethanolamine utilization cobalamin adenosyltransferase